MRSSNSAFLARLQQDDVFLTEVVDVEFQNGLSYHWHTGNDPLTRTRSGVPTAYQTFPGSGGMPDEQLALGVSNANFTLANSGSDLQAMLLSNDFALAKLYMGWVFVDTPDLGYMSFFTGKVGDFTWDRLQITGQTRNIWKSLSIQWPYYTYQDNCAWRFGSAGCGVNATSLAVNISSIVVNSSTAAVVLCASGTLSQSYANGSFMFGRVQATTGANSGLLRAVLDHTGDQLTFSHPFAYTVQSGDQYTIQPGCRKRLVQDCNSRFNNTLNNQSFPAIPKPTDAY
jgi:uncharacterized phage protein (TIGR02218 family)